MKLLDSNRFFLKGTDNRFLHLGTCSHGAREFFAFQDVSTGKVYIEEVTGGSLTFVKEEELAKELANYFTIWGCLNINRPSIPDSEWYKKR